jgi:hypothetical protein
MIYHEYYNQNKLDVLWHDLTIHTITAIIVKH